MNDKCYNVTILSEVRQSSPTMNNKYCKVTTLSVMKKSSPSAGRVQLAPLVLQSHQPLNRNISASASAAQSYSYSIIFTSSPPGSYSSRIIPPGSPPPESPIPGSPLHQVHIPPGSNHQDHHFTRITGSQDHHHQDHTTRPRNAIFHLSSLEVTRPVSVRTVDHLCDFLFSNFNQEDLLRPDGIL